MAVLASQQEKQPCDQATTVVTLMTVIAWTLVLQGTCESPRKRPTSESTCTLPLVGVWGVPDGENPQGQRHYALTHGLALERKRKVYTFESLYSSNAFPRLGGLSNLPAVGFCVVSAALRKTATTVPPHGVKCDSYLAFSCHRPLSMLVGGLLLFVNLLIRFQGFLWHVADGVC